MDIYEFDKFLFELVFEKKRITKKDLNTLNKSLNILFKNGLTIDEVFDIIFNIKDILNEKNAKGEIFVVCDKRKVERGLIRKSYLLDEKIFISDYGIIDKESIGGLCKIVKK